MQQLLKPQELAALINVSVPTIMNWHYGGIIPARLHVGRVSENYQTLASWLQKRKQPPLSGPAISCMAGALLRISQNL